MNRARIHYLQIALLAVGLTVWGLQTNRLYRDGGLIYPLPMR